MRKYKLCERCGLIISDIDTDDYFRHLSVKYCDRCRDIVQREKTAARVANLRKRKKEKDKYRDEQLELLKQENELLRQRIIQLRAERI